MEKAINTITAAIGAIIGFAFGQVNGLLIALVGLMCIDYITGIAKGYINKNLSSGIGYKGIIKKIVILMLVSVAHLIDAYVLGGNKAVLMTATMMFYAGNEGISIIENAVEIGLPVPQKLKKALKQIAEESENDKKEE